ncbi:MAG: nucleotidyltransferase [Candidatus Sumerlaeota bacterium]|nr:nucleotidyltransferase [Candidatus Sumerlaeota bacterium]
MLSLLIENNVEFLLVGAYAMAAHGYPRATADIDIFVKPDPSNAARVFKALSEFGAALKDVTIQDFETPGTIFQIGVEPRRIDIITEIDGLTFEEASEGRDIINIEGLAVPLISKQKLIINKLATGRDKDRLDAERLQGKKEK